jgi:hypothetical protein
MLESKHKRGKLKMARKSWGEYRLYPKGVRSGVSRPTVYKIFRIVVSIYSSKNTL